MKTVIVKCDACSEDLTSTGNSVGYRLRLANENIPCRGGFCTDMMAYPSLEYDHYFCNVRCLDHWTDRRRHEQDLAHRAWENRRKEYEACGHTRQTGYPSLSNEELEKLTAEHKAAALIAFPMERPKRS